MRNKVMAVIISFTIVTIYDLSPKEKAPIFTGKTFEGKEISLSAFEGKTVLIDFWANW